MAAEKKIIVTYRHKGPQEFTLPTTEMTTWLFDDLGEAIGQMLGILSGEDTSDIVSLEMKVEGE